MVIEANPLVMIVKNHKRRAAVKVFQNDEDNTPMDPVELTLTVQCLNSSRIIYSDDYFSPPVGGGRIVRATTGSYYISWGDPAATANQPYNTETDRSRAYLFMWTVVGALGGDEEPRAQTVKVVTPKVLEWIRQLREQLDKGRKDVSVDPEDFCPLGYTDDMLYGYLVGGLNTINTYQPYPTWCELDRFPDCFGQTLIESAILVGVNAQTLLAIDSDVENYSAQGNAFVINHTPKLAAFNAALSQRLDKLIREMKLHFVRSGTAKIEAGMGFRYQALLDMAPTGATFRNVLTSGR